MERWTVGATGAEAFQACNLFLATSAEAVASAVVSAASIASISLTLASRSEKRVSSSGVHWRCSLVMDSPSAINLVRSARSSDLFISITPKKNA